MAIETLESERDRLNEHLQKMQVTNGSLTDEIDRWKSRAEKLAEYADHNGKCPQSFFPPSKKACDCGLAEALSDFEAGKP